MNLTGQLIKELGYKPAAWWKSAIGEGQGRDFADEAAVRAFLDEYDVKPLPMRESTDAPPFNINLEPETAEEKANLESVSRHMYEIMRLPTVVAGAIMPDACPAGGQLGTIPVGGVIAAKESIFPSMHSADICCSMAASIFPKESDPIAILDAGMKLSHFGAGGRPHSVDMQPSADLLQAFADNRFLSMTTDAAIKHFGTQGDGNHFFYVGRLRSDDRIVLVTHHGSRKPGALLYKAGMDVAQRLCKKIAPDVPTHLAWIPSETEEGETYWLALQLIRQWTKKNHFAIHDAVAKYLNLKVKYRFWNEHNFVFRRDDGLFYHGKGATPAWRWFAPDSSGLTLIPMNMAEPILITRGLDNPKGLGFAPHGAGRNLSRSGFVRQNAGRTVTDMIAEQAPGIDVRYFNGFPDISELPGAYKNAATVTRQIEDFGLAEIVDRIDPIGNIMAGDAPWRKS